MRPPKPRSAGRARGSEPDHDVHALSGAYALDALTPLERHRFEAHLDQCPSCRLEVAGLRETATELSHTVATDPPPHVKPRIVAASARLAQRRPWADRIPQRGLGRAVRLVAAAAVVLAIGGSSYVIGQQRDEPTRVTAEAVFDAPDARVRIVSLPEGQFRVAFSSDLGLMAVDADMPALPADRAYQAWVITDEARSLGVLEDGEGFLPIPTTGRLAVTVEPDGGSVQPTTVPLFAIALPAT